MPKAAIDIGSNSLLLTIVDDDDRIVHDEARVVGLGRGLGDRGLIAPDRIKAADKVLDKIERQLRTLHDKRIFSQRREAQRDPPKKRSSV